MRLNSTSAEPMAVIRVPKTPRNAYNPRRPAGTLLQSQLKHLEWAVRPARERTAKAFRPRSAYTEGEAAARIAALNQELHVQATSPRGVVPPDTVAPPPAAAKPRSKSGPKRKAKQTAKPAHTTPTPAKRRSRRAARRTR